MKIEDEAKRVYLACQITDLLRERGPLDREEIATRLCVASATRLAAAITIAVRRQWISQVYRSGDRCWRVMGDTRGRGPSTLQDLYRHRRLSRAALESAGELAS